MDRGGRRILEGRTLWRISEPPSEVSETGENVFGKTVTRGRAKV